MLINLRVDMRKQKIDLDLKVSDWLESIYGWKLPLIISLRRGEILFLSSRSVSDIGVTYGVPPVCTFNVLIWCCALVIAIVGLILT